MHRVTVRRVILSASLVLVSLNSPAVGQERGERAELRRAVIEHLNAAVADLARLGEGAQAEHLQELAAALKRRLGGEGKSVRNELERRMAVLRYAKGAFAEAEKPDAVQAIEQIMHATELRMEGRREESERKKLSRGNQVEYLMWAAKFLRGAGATEKSGAVEHLAEQIASESREHRRGQANELEVARHQLVMMRAASGALAEAGKADAADLLQNAIRAAEVRIEGRRGEKAQAILEKDPKVGAKAELLLYAAKFLREYDKPDHAEAATKLGRSFAEKARRGRGEGREREREGDRSRGVAERVEQLEQRVRQLEEQITGLLERRRRR